MKDCSGCGTSSPNKQKFMPRLDTPLQLSPVMKPKIWGRRDLSPLFVGKKRLLASGVPMGEAWLTGDGARFLNGPPAGMTLAEAAEKYGPELCGLSWREPRFPILTKYIFTSDWLSVQVHPDDVYAREHDPGSPGKCEMWYVVRAARGARLLLGAKRGVTREKLRAALERGKSREILQSIRPSAGDAFLIQPGTVHALGPQLVLFEAEQNSDLTYRLDDFGRLGLDGKPRPLHLEKGMEVAEVNGRWESRLPRFQFGEPYGLRRYVVACRHFAVEELMLRKRATFHGSPERVEILTVLEGEGRVETSAGWMGYRMGEAWLIPPGTGLYRLVPGDKTRLLKAYVPDLEKDFRRPLLKCGRSAKQVARIVCD
jgi:mannose-6-phosphate isomerase